VSFSEDRSKNDVGSIESAVQTAEETCKPSRDALVAFPPGFSRPMVKRPWDAIAQAGLPGRLD
jgi:hypothetical protein